MALSSIASALAGSASLVQDVGLESVVCRLTNGEGGCDCFLMASRDPLLDEDLDLDGSEFLGSFCCRL